MYEVNFLWRKPEKPGLITESVQDKDHTQEWQCQQPHWYQPYDLMSQCETDVALQDTQNSTVYHLEALN